jgi:hypothetical protein
LSEEGLRQKLRAELEAKPETRPLGSGWLSGTLAFLLGAGALVLALCRVFPGVLITPQLAVAFASPWFRIGLIVMLGLAFALALLNLALRPNRILGFVAIGLTLLASLILQMAPVETDRGGLYFGLDFFVLNVVLTGLLFVPLERLSPLKREQRLFRTEWRSTISSPP